MASFEFVADVTEIQVSQERGRAYWFIAWTDPDGTDRHARSKSEAPFVYGTNWGPGRYRMVISNRLITQMEKVT